MSVGKEAAVSSEILVAFYQISCFFKIIYVLYFESVFSVNVLMKCTYI
jgi:hypothetical protein